MAMAKLGEIEVQLLRCRKSGPSKIPVLDDFEPIGKRGIPEKALKGRAIFNHAE